MRGSFTIGILILLLVGTGCSILTKNQVKEVNKFAVAAKAYTDMPGAVVAEHGKIRKIKQVIKASSYGEPDVALDAIEIGIAQQDAILERGRKADAALNVLSNYSELLVKLTADDFTTELQASSEILGKNIDKGIAEYNKLSGAPVGVFGSKVAAAVRGIGGIYIKYKQEKALKEAVESADKVIPEMMRSVQGLMFTYLDEDQVQQVKKTLGNDTLPDLPGDLLSSEKKEIINAYKFAVKQFASKQPPCLPKMVADQIEAVNSTSELAVKTIIAADSFNRAHAKLVETVNEKRNLPKAIDEIQVLSDQVKSAIELKKKIDKQ